MSGEGQTGYIKLTSSFDFINMKDSGGLLTEGTTSWETPSNLDAFLTEVYEYYQGKGFQCSLYSRIFNFL